MKNIIFKIAVSASLFVILFTSLNFAQPEIEKNISKALEQSYNFKWEDAEETLNNLIEKYPEDPRGYHYLSGIYLWYYLGSKNKTDYDRFVDYSDTTIDKAEKIIDEKPEDEKTLYILGADYNYRAIVFTNAGNFLDAAWATKKSESYLSHLLSIDSLQYDAYLGLGLYNFAVGHIPSAFNWALSLVGFDGDKETGLKYIKIAAEKGKRSKVEAQYYLSQILSEVMFDYDGSKKYIKSLIKKYPDNLLFNYSLAVLELKQRNLKESEKYLKKIINKREVNFKQIISFSNFLIGDIFFRRNEFDSAKVYYEQFLKTAVDKDYTGIGSYRLALCYEITKDRKSAIKYFNLAGFGNMDLDDDIFAKRKSNIYIKRKLSDNEIAVLKASNFIEAGNYKKSKIILDSVITNIKSEKLKAEAYLYLSDVSYYLNDYDSSIVYADTLMNLDVSDETWIKPFANFNLARAYFALKNNPKSEEYLEEAESFSDFDYENKLKSLVSAFKTNKLLASNISVN